MPRTLPHLAALLILAALTACEARTPHPEPTPATSNSFARRPTATPSPSSPTRAPLQTVVRYTAGAQPDQPLPLLLVLHGLGDNPTNFIRVYADLPLPLRIVAVRAPTTYHGGFSWFPVRIGPERATARNDDVNRAAAALAASLPELLRRYPTRGKPLVSGFSQGGMLAFALAVHHPSTISAAFPIGGALDVAQLPDRAPNGSPALFAFHGEADPLVRFGLTLSLVNTMKQRGYPARLYAYPNLKHSISAPLRAQLFEMIGQTLASWDTTQPPSPSTRDTATP